MHIVCFLYKFVVDIKSAVTNKLKFYKINGIYIISSTMNYLLMVQQLSLSINNSFLVELLKLFISVIL